MERVIALFKNKYFITTLIFVGWMLFFDKNDMLSQYEYKSEVTALKDEKNFYTSEITVIKRDLNELNTNLNTAEKFAREKYFMKKDNEDVFVIITETKEGK